MKKPAFSIGMMVAILLAIIFTTSTPPEPETQIRDYFEQQISDQQVKVFGRVLRILPDDTKGSRHQKFIILTNDLTVLIVHNIDLAPRVPIKKDDYVWVYGEYEWNEKGGLIHWTHKDPKGIHPNGFITHKKKTYE